MKTGVVIVNTARGKIMNESDLVDALESGKVWSAGLDVFETEPHVHPKLLDNPRVLLLPHVGTFTSGSRRRMEEWAISNLQAAVDTGKLKNHVQEQVGVKF
jgi:glyoxylate reductase